LLGRPKKQRKELAQRKPTHFFCDVKVGGLAKNLGRRMKKLAAQIIKRKKHKKGKSERKSAWSLREETLAKCARTKRDARKERKRRDRPLLFRK